MANTAQAANRRMSDEEFANLLERHRHEFYRYVHRNVWNQDVSEDVFSAAVLAAYKGLDNFQAGSNFRAWMYKILTNKCFVANREIQRSAIDVESIDQQLLATEPQADSTPLEDPEWFLQQCGDEVYRALRLLSTAERSCFLLLTLGKYSYKEISEILEMPVGTVLTHLSRGRTKMRQRLLNYAGQKRIISKASNLRKLKEKLA
jgi:RNA polymerase sigma-70 factor (ECF subfamily)